MNKVLTVVSTTLPSRSTSMVGVAPSFPITFDQGLTFPHFSAHRKHFFSHRYVSHLVV
jgi:hypothetical protein